MEKLPVGVVFDVRLRKFITNVVIFVAYCVHVGQNECGGLAIVVRNPRSSWVLGPFPPIIKSYTNFHAIFGVPVSGVDV
jgi:hypothetical protein